MRKTVTMLVTVTIPKDMTAREARREVRYLISEGAGWSTYAGESVKTKSVKGITNARL